MPMPDLKRAQLIEGRKPRHFVSAGVARAELTPDARLTLFGQELNPKSFAICQRRHAPSRPALLESGANEAPQDRARIRCRMRRAKRSPSSVCTG